MSLLEVRGLSKNFGGLAANQNVDITVEKGEIIGLIGPNGAGKTTLFNCITGFYKPDGGKVIFDAHDITGWSPEKICKVGIARTHQLAKPFAQITVLENVMIGTFLHTRSTSVARSRALEFLEFTGLISKKNMMAANITVADKKRLEVARALATKPQLIMLDEAMSGLTPTERKEAVDLVLELQKQGLTIFLVEHVMEVVMPISGRVAVLDYGCKIAEGPPSEIVRNERVIKAYLGEKYRAPS
jgi:branched-chain amino acid transport system ATP-binding protein